MNEDQIKGLAILRKPFPANQISRLPKPTKAQTDAVRADFKAGIRCEECGGWHHPNVVHLDYVGHAAVTDRLLDADPEWMWQPVAPGPDGSPTMDEFGGIWIYLTVCGITRLGYGDAQGKLGADAMKERIGDAIRNAAMRFGVALELWHKGDLHAENHDNGEKPADTGKADLGNPAEFREELQIILSDIEHADKDHLAALRDRVKNWPAVPAERKVIVRAYNLRASELDK